MIDSITHDPQPTTHNTTSKDLEIRQYLMQHQYLSASTSTSSSTLSFLIFYMRVPCIMHLIIIYHHVMLDHCLCHPTCSALMMSTIGDAISIFWQGLAALSWNMAFCHPRKLLLGHGWAGRRMIGLASTYAITCGFNELIITSLDADMTLN